MSFVVSPTNNGHINREYILINLRNLHKKIRPLHYMQQRNSRFPNFIPYMIDVWADILNFRLTQKKKESAFIKLVNIDLLKRPAAI